VPTPQFENSPGVPWPKKKFGGYFFRGKDNIKMVRGKDNIKVRGKDNIKMFRGKDNIKMLGRSVATSL
jgi:hypothetical protein